MRLLHLAIAAAAILAACSIDAQTDYEVTPESVREITIGEYSGLPNDTKKEVVPQILRNIISVYKQKSETRVQAYCMGDLDRIMEPSGESKLERISRERLDLAVKESAHADSAQSIVFGLTEHECNLARLQARNNLPEKREPTSEEIEKARNNKIDFMVPVSKRSQADRKEETEEERRERIGQNKIDFELPVSENRQSSQRSRRSDPSPKPIKPTGTQIVLPYGMKLSGDSIRVAVTNLPGNPQDWVTLVPANASLSTVGDRHFTEGLKTGTWSFVPRKSGRYEIRVYYDWPNGGYDVKARVGFDVK